MEKETVDVENVRVVAKMALDLYLKQMPPEETDPNRFKPVECQEYCVWIATSLWRQVADSLGVITTGHENREDYDEEMASLKLEQRFPVVNKPLKTKKHPPL